MVDRVVVKDVALVLVFSGQRLGDAGLMLLSSCLPVLTPLVKAFLGCSLGDWTGEAAGLLRIGLSALTGFGESCS